MRKLLFSLASFLGLAYAHAQPAPTPDITAIVCAQNAVQPLIASGQFGLIQCDPYGRPYVTPIGFTPLSAYATPISVTTTSAANLLPSGASVTIYNTGSNAAYVKFGTSSSVIATTANDVIPAGGGCGFNIDVNSYIATITASSTTTLNLSGGTGLAPGCWGGGSGSSVTLPVSIANGGTGQTTASAAFNALSPMTTAGDIIYGGTAGAGTRLAAGMAAQALHGGTTPAWLPVLGSVTEQIFTTNGTYTPNANLVTAYVLCVGSGGGGGGAALRTIGQSAGGGGGGGTGAGGFFSAATIGASQTVTIGTAGTGGTAGNNAGGTGGDVSFGALIKGKGGSGGAGAATDTGALGGAGGSGASSVGTDIYKGADGETAMGGTVLPSVLGTHGGFGGASFFGGSQAGPVNANGAAPSAFNYGSGGSGGHDNSGTNRSGGNGVAGKCMVTEYNSQ